MQIGSFGRELSLNEDKVSVDKILESSFSTELRIVFRKGQVMREHTAPFPIIVHILKGCIEFGAQDSVHTLAENDILTLEGNVPHNLVALEDSMVRLTLSKSDRPERVSEIAERKQEVK